MRNPPLTHRLVLAACVAVATALALVSAAFPNPKNKARAIGIWTGIAAVGLAIGPTVGGFLTESAGWRTIFLVNVVRSLRSGEIAGDDPWDAFTLEWSTTSPPLPENFATIPAVTGRRPLWDRKHPELRDAR